MSRILISYRREDSADVTGRIYDRLVEEFGSRTIFKDVDSIPLGIDFRTYLDAQVAKCEVFLAVIGRDWIKKRSGKGKYRLDDPDDVVRIEIELALKRQIPLIPVLVSGANIPLAARLPISLRELSYRNGIPVRADPDFHRDMDRLIEHLKQQVKDVKEHHLEPYYALQAKQRLKTERSTLNVIPQSREQPVDMVKVPKGPFLYGKTRDREVIDHDFWIDRYPVTNEKFRKFILENGYGSKAHWSPKGWKWRIENDITVPRYWDDTKWNKADHPVVGVSYYEAEAYAKWAGKRLPSEREWEKAARSEDGRIYPWGDEFDKTKCNSPKLYTAQILTARTTPVTQYPEGVSPYGCYDMTGNVWEWCADRYEAEEPDAHGLRGGSWFHGPVELGSSDRWWGGANRTNDLGFRLVKEIVE